MLQAGAVGRQGRFPGYWTAGTTQLPQPLGGVQVVVTVEGPEPGYVATPIVLVEAAMELLSHRAEMCQAIGAQGGVVTPGQLLLLHGESYINRLRAAGMSITCEDLA